MEDKTNTPEKTEKKMMPDWKVILWLILFWPVGLYFMWARSSWQKNTKIVVSCVFAVLFIIGMFSQSTSETNNTSHIKNTKTLEPSTIPEDTPEPVQEPKITQEEQDEVLETTVQSAEKPDLSQSNGPTQEKESDSVRTVLAKESDEIDKIVAIIKKELGRNYITTEVWEFDEYDNQGRIINRIFSIQNVEFTWSGNSDQSDIKHNLVKVGAILKALVKQGYKLDQAYFAAKGNMIDQYGNGSTESVMKVRIYGETIEKINWDQSDIELGYTTLYNLAKSKEIVYGSVKELRIQ